MTEPTVLVIGFDPNRLPVPDKDAIATGCMEQMWNEGPGKDFARHGHYLNMTNPQYTKVAIGFYTTREGKVWSVQNFK